MQKTPTRVSRTGVLVVGGNLRVADEFPSHSIAIMRWDAVPFRNGSGGRRIVE